MSFHITEVNGSGAAYLVAEYAHQHRHLAKVLTEELARLESNTLTLQLTVDTLARISRYNTEAARLQKLVDVYTNRIK